MSQPPEHQATPSAPTSRPPLWTRDLLLAWVVNLCTGFGFYALMTTMAVYAVRQFGASDTVGGVAASMFIIGATATRPAAGILVDRAGGRRVLVLAMAGASVAGLGYLLLDGLAALLVVRAVHGVAFALANTAALSLAQASFPASRRAEGTGYFAMSTTVASAIGPFVALTVVGHLGYTALFGVSLGVALTGMVLALLIRPVPRVAREPGERRRLRPADLVHPAVIPIGLFMVVMGSAYGGMMTYLNSYAELEGLETGARLYFLAYAGVMVLSRPFLGKVQDRRGDNTVVYPAIVALAAALAVLAAATNDAMVVLAGTLTGLGFGTLIAAGQSIAVSAVRRHQIGVAIASYFLLLDLGVGFGPVLLGAVAEQVGYREMYAAVAGVVLVATLLYLLVHGRHPVARSGRPAE